jgi:predicted DNA-binding transcriptional regulator YafY
MKKMELPPLFEILPTGIENAVQARELAERLGVEIRSLRAAISRERRKGAVICSNSDGTRGRCGYFIPKNHDELKAFISTERARIATHTEAILSAEKALSMGI